MKTTETDFLNAHSDRWIARRAPKFSVLNVHVAEITASAARIFPELGARELLIPSWRWRFLFAFRAAIGKLFGWDRGLIWNGHEQGPLDRGRHYAFFLIEHVEEPCELAMSVGNRLTGALMAWVLEESDGGTKVFNVTCANFPTWQGRLYWRVIRPFHDALIEDSLIALARRVEKR
ncbi:MAG: DUF2867 domain-containing protein [Candidatus Acidiferrales bacterium]